MLHIPSNGLLIIYSFARLFEHFRRTSKAYFLTQMLLLDSYCLCCITYSHVAYPSNGLDISHITYHNISYTGRTYVDTQGRYICYIGRTLIHSTQSYSSDEFPKLLSINIASSGCSLRMTGKVIPLTNFRNYWLSYFRFSDDSYSFRNQRP